MSLSRSTRFPISLNVLYCSQYNVCSTLATIIFLSFCFIRCVFYFSVYYSPCFHMIPTCDLNHFKNESPSRAQYFFYIDFFFLISLTFNWLHYVCGEGPLKVILPHAQQHPDAHRSRVLIVCSAPCFCFAQGFRLSPAMGKGGCFISFIIGLGWLLYVLLPLK